MNVGYRYDFTRQKCHNSWSGSIWARGCLPTGWRSTPLKHDVGKNDFQRNQPHNLQSSRRTTAVENGSTHEKQNMYIKDDRSSSTRRSNFWPKYKIESSRKWWQKDLKSKHEYDKWKKIPQKCWCTGDQSRKISSLVWLGRRSSSLYQGPRMRSWKKLVITVRVWLHPQVIIVTRRKIDGTGP